MPHWSPIPSPTMCIVDRRHFRETFPTDYWTFVSRLPLVWTTWPTRHLCTETWLQETSSWLVISYARWHNYPCDVYIVSEVTTNLHVDVSVAVYKENSFLYQIGDFGMTRDLANDSVYHSQGGKVPLKWTAPEVKNMHFYTSECCVCGTLYGFFDITDSQ